MPQNRQVISKMQYPFDSLKVKDEDAIYGPNNKKILLVFQRIIEGEQQTEGCSKRKIKIGSCKLVDNKMEKSTNFEIVMPKDDRFSCDNLKETTVEGQQTVLTFTYKPQQADPFIAKIPVFSGIGQWKDIKSQFKFSGGYLKAVAVDAISFEVVLRAYINQL